MLSTEKIPPDPDNPGRTIVSRDVVELINSKLLELEGTPVRRVSLPREPERFSAERIRAYGQAVSHSIVELSRATMSLLSHGLYLPAVVVARSLLEHFASFYGFVEELKDIVRSGDYESAYGLAENTAMRHTLKGLPSEALAPKVAKLILRLENRMPNAKSDYDFLCQYGHPSAFSIWLLYGSDGHVQENYWNFQPGGWDPEQSYKCASVVLGQLRHISADINNLDMCAAELSEKAPRG